MDTYQFILCLIGSLLAALLVWLIVGSVNRYMLTVRSKVDAMRSDFEKAKTEISDALAKAQSAQMSMVRQFRSLKNAPALADEEDDAGGLPPAIAAVMSGMGLDPTDPAAVQKGLAFVADKLKGGSAAAESGAFL